MIIDVQLRDWHPCFRVRLTAVPHFSAGRAPARRLVWRVCSCCRSLVSLLSSAAPESPSSPLGDPDDWLYGALGAGATFAGRSVNETTAMRFSTVFACVSLKAGLIGNLPLHVYKKTKEGRILADEHRLYPML